MLTPTDLLNGKLFKRTLSIMERLNIRLVASRGSKVEQKNKKKNQQKKVKLVLFRSNFYVSHDHQKFEKRRLVRSCSKRKENNKRCSLRSNFPEKENVRDEQTYFVLFCTSLALNWNTIFKRETFRVRVIALICVRVIHSRIILEICSRSK